MPIKREVQIGDCRLLLGDCLEILPLLPKVDAVVTDPPYGVTDHEWDNVVSSKSWMIGHCAIVTASEPFATTLINEAQIKFRFDLVWVKNCVSNFMNAKNMPMRRHERVLVFGEYKYTPQMRRRTKEEISRLNSIQRKKQQYANPDSVIEIASVNNRNKERTIHPSQKPVELFHYLIATFTKHADTILDPFMGSGTTGVACAKLGRKFIGIELEPKYFDIACKRIEEAYQQPDMFIEPAPKPVQEGMDI